jgi:hypothetical protein
MSILISKKGKETQIVDKSDFQKEYNLQEYITKNPESIPIYELKEDKRLFVAKREFPTSSGPIDAVAVDEDGDIYVIETKLYKNPDKRTVVAQALDYGAALWKHVTDFRAFIEILDEETLRRFSLRFREKIQEFFTLDDEQVDSMLDVIQDNLMQGNIKFVILMDSIEKRLKDLIVYINQNSKFDIYATELEYYRFEEYEIVIPRVFGSEVKKSMSKPSDTRQWDRESWYKELKNRREAEEVEIVKRMEILAEKRPLILAWSSDRKDQRATLWFFYDSCRLFGIRVDGKIEIRFGNIMKHPPFDNEAKRGELASRLNEIPSVDLPSTLTFTGYPSISIVSLKSKASLNRFFKAFDWCIQEIEDAKL